MSKIKVSVNVQSSMDKVWTSWTQAEHITKWNFANDEWCCPAATNDLRPEGKFSWRMEAKDGSMGFDFEGTYDEVVQNKHISYHMSDGRKVDINFLEKNDAIELVESFDAEGTHADEQQRAGWQAILNNFKQYVESS